MKNNMNKKIILAGGCFWGMEELIRTQVGVVNTEVGYTGVQMKTQHMKIIQDMPKR